MGTVGMVTASMRGLASAVLMVALCLVSVSRTAQAESAVSLAAAARADCEAGRRAPDRATRKQHFDRGQMLAERAVALDDRNAEAHFAVFCNMGELMRLDGESLSSALGVHRLMAEGDRTLELDQHHTDALG